VRRNEETWGGAEEAKVVIQKGFQTKQKKKIIALLFPLSFHRTVGRSSLSSCLFAEKKKFSLSLSVVLSSSSSLCKGEQQHKEMRREEEMTFSAKL
jgi:hypothetical protein